MSDFTRLTVIGNSRKAELVVPSDEIIGTLVVQLAELLAEPVTAVTHPLVLTRPSGQQLDLGSTLALQGVRDGELIRLLRQADAPPPPEVADVTDVVADERENHPALWGAAHRRALAAVAIALGTGILGALYLAAGTGDPVLLLGAFLLLVVSALGTGLARLRWSATALLSAAIGVVPAGATVLSTLLPPADSAPLLSTLLLSTLFCGAGMAWLALGLGLGVGLRLRAALWAGGLGLALSVLAVALLSAGVPAQNMAAITGVLAIFGIGLMPWYAMTASGLTGLDDQVIGGVLAERVQVTQTLHQAYATLSWATAALALPLTLSIIVLLSGTNPWSLWLGLALLALTMLRTRAYPLAVQAGTLWAASAAAVVIALFTQTVLDPVSTVAVVAVLTVLVALLGAAAPAAHVRARLRKLGDICEMLAAISTIPLILGGFGLYADLLGTFSR